MANVRCPFRRFFDGIDSELEDSHFTGSCLAPIYLLVTDRRFNRYLAGILPRRLRSFCKHFSPHPIVTGRDKKSIDRWWYASRLSLFSFLSSLDENNISEVYLLHGFSSLKPLAFFQVFRRLPGVCIVKALSCWFTNVNVNQKGLLSIRLSFLKVYSEYAHFNHVRLTASGLMYGIISSGFDYYYYSYKSPCPPTPRCLEHDDSKNFKIDLFKALGILDQLPRERATVKAGVYVHHIVRQAEYFTPSFLPHVERTLHHALSASAMICDR